MRVIDQQLKEAIQNFRPFSRQNRTFHRMAGTQNGWELVLHGNVIATFDDGGKDPTVPVTVSLAGWNTPLTRQVLNSLDGINIRVKNFIPYLNGREIDKEGIYPLNLFR